ncbi:SAM-dependent methyltransferase [Arachidicoccus ginsenosidimutans]|uniref:O-methyltransferase n=1 Tax=Arachidicoccus sp. BS20 TaxID=1850526 RepID=UPI0007F15228|nr:class I SAM-dependent methyltransferase [Arachidicoccus sp. BS20]ANI89468.1 SAM-dependent methyltransferase [Arachidicoccus sp. BS20]
MYSKYQLTKKYLHYLLYASNGKGHGIHSPFVFDFVTKVLNDKKNYRCYKEIETLRSSLLKDETVLKIEDFGAGSRVNATNERKISAVAKSALKPKKFGRLLYRMVQHYQPKTILELGTCFGITTSYLSNGNAGAQVSTMEGAAQIAAVAKKDFEKLSLKNIELIEGNFDETLPEFIQQFQAKNKTIDFAFIDGNHRYEPTVRYFHSLLEIINENSILIFDDIHWSEEMENAWKEIIAHEAITLSIDLFFIGIVFFRKEFKAKQDFEIKFL